MPKQSEIDRMLVLLYRSNNAHDFVNFTRNYGWLDKLPMAGLEELHSLLGSMQRDVQDEMARRNKVGMTTFPAEHYVGGDAVN